MYPVSKSGCGVVMISTLSEEFLAFIEKENTRHFLDRRSVQCAIPHVQCAEENPLAQNPNNSKIEATTLVVVVVVSTIIVCQAVPMHACHSDHSWNSA